MIFRLLDILLCASLLLMVDSQLEFGRSMAVSLTRSFLNPPEVKHVPVVARGSYAGAASHRVQQGLVLQTCVAASENECLAGRGQASPTIFTMPGAIPDLPSGTFVTTLYALLQPAFGLPTLGVHSSYSLDLRLLSQGVDADGRSLAAVPMVVQMSFKNSDCPTTHVAMGLSGECGVMCMMYDSRLAKWSPIGITTGQPGLGVVNCTLSTLPVHILINQFLNEIRIAMVVDKSANVLQTFFNASFFDSLVRWTGATRTNFRIEALRPFSQSRLDMTRVFVVIASLSTDPESIFQALKRLPAGGRVVADPSTGWTQGPLTVLMVEKYYTQVPPVSTDDEGTPKCFEQTDCPSGLYCDEFSHCFSCGPGSVSPGYCDSITYDCCSTAFRQQCANNPYNCSDTPPSAPSPRLSYSTFSPSPAPSSRVSSPPPTPGVLDSFVSRPTHNNNGTLFRIVSLQNEFVPLNESLLRTAGNVLALVDDSLSAVSLRSQGLALTTIGEIGEQPALPVYDALVQQGSIATSSLRSHPLFSHIISIRMLCAYGLWRPRCSKDTLEGSLNATLAVPPESDPQIRPKVVANLEAGSGVSDRFVVTDVRQEPNTTFVSFSIVPPEQGEPSSESIYDILSYRLPQRKTITVLMNFSALEPDRLPAVQRSLCTLSNTALGITLTREDLCSNITLRDGPQQQWTFIGPITTPLTPAMIIGDNDTFIALQNANNGTALNQSDITVLISDSPIVPQTQACPPPFVRLASGLCSSPRGVVIPPRDDGLSLLAKILIGVFVGLALCLLLCLCFCCWKRLFCFKKKDYKEEPQEPVTSIAFIDQTPKKTEEKKPDVKTDNKPLHPPEISPLHKPSFSHRPISLDEHEGTSRNGFEYDSHSSDEYPDTEKRSFHFRLETKPTPPAITPMKLHSPSSNAGSPSETMLSGASPFPPFMSLQTPIPQRRVPPQPRIQPMFSSSLPPSLAKPHVRKESLDAKHGSESYAQRTTPVVVLQPSHRQTTQSRLQSTPYQAPRQNTPSQLRNYQQSPRGEQTTQPHRVAAEQTPISSMAFSAPPTDTDGDDEDGSNTTQEGEYSDENRTRYGRSRSRGAPLDERRNLVARGP